MRRRGLTLLEMVLALAMLAVVGSLLSAFVADLDRNRAIIDDQAERVADCSVLFDRLELALQTAVVATPSGSAGVTVDDGTLTLVSTRSRSAPGGGAFVTLRCRSTDAGVRMTEEGGGETVAGVVLAGSKIAFRAHDGQQWREAYDSASAGGLPTMVEVSVWYRPAADDGETTNAVDDTQTTLDPLAAALESGDDEERPADRRRVIALPDPTTGGDS